VIRVFGVLGVEDGLRTLGARDLGGARPKQVLEILLAARGHRVSTDRLAELLWGDARPQNSIGSIQTFVSALRRRLAPDRERARELVITEPAAYALPLTSSSSTSTASTSCSSDRRASRPTARAAHSNTRSSSCVETFSKTSPMQLGHKSFAAPTKGAWWERDWTLPTQH
jgi:DNA-binding winged helix-turn-helix (wHTH) protein